MTNVINKLHDVNKKLLKYFIKKCAAIRIHLKGILKDERGIK